MNGDEGAMEEGLLEHHRLEEAEAAFAIGDDEVDGADEVVEMKPLVVDVEHVARGEEDMKRADVDKGWECHLAPPHLCLGPQAPKYDLSFEPCPVRLGSSMYDRGRQMHKSQSLTMPLAVNAAYGLSTVNPSPSI